MKRDQQNWLCRRRKKLGNGEKKAGGGWIGEKKREKIHSLETK